VALLAATVNCTVEPAQIEVDGVGWVLMVGLAYTVIVAVEAAEEQVSPSFCTVTLTVTVNAPSVAFEYV
jgi:hypothetical protein